jgi:hypothetical protein
VIINNRSIKSNGNSIVIPLANSYSLYYYQLQMEEEHIFTANDLTADTSPKKNGRSGVNKVLMGIVVLLLLVVTGGGAYFLGSKKGGNNNEPTPTQSPFKAETLGEQAEEGITPTIAPTATISGTITPSVTPKVTAIPTLKINPNLKTLQKLPTSTPTPIPTLKYQINQQSRQLYQP